ncbi:unnamed protein product [Amaranthus hypochondriacus]
MQPPTNERTRLCKDGFSSLHTYSRNSGLYGVCCCCYGYGFCPESFSWLSLCSSCHVILTVHISILTFREQRSSQQSLESLFDAQSSQAPSSARSKLVISIYSLRVLLYMINPRRRSPSLFAFVH